MTAAPNGTTVNLPQPTSATSERKDLLALKNKLADALGENGPLYWKALKEFVTAKLNRQEFDFYANLYLTRENASLHNAFILATIHNASRNQPPPAGSRSVGWSRSHKRERDGEKGDSDKDPKRKKLKKEVLALGKAERERIKNVAKKNGVKKKAAEILWPCELPTPIDRIPSNYASDYALGLHTSLCVEAGELPDAQAVSQRMVHLALHEGLIGGIGAQAADLMVFALESHLKNVITACINKVRIVTGDTLTESISCSSELTEPGAEKSTAAAAPPPPPPPTTTTTTTSSSSTATATTTSPPLRPPESSTNGSASDEHSTTTETSTSPIDSTAIKSNVITKGDLAFTFDLTPNILVEAPAGREQWILDALSDDEDQDQD